MVLTIISLDYGHCGNDRVKYNDTDDVSATMNNYHNTENDRIKSRDNDIRGMFKRIMILRLMNVTIPTRQLSITTNHELRISHASSANQRACSLFIALISYSIDEVFVR